MHQTATFIQPGEVREVFAALLDVVARLAPAEVPLSWAPKLFADFDAIDRLAAGAKTLLAARVEESEAWRREGFRTPADHIAQFPGSA